MEPACRLIHTNALAASLSDSRTRPRRGGASWHRNTGRLNQRRVFKDGMHKTMAGDVPATVNLSLAESICACVAAARISHSNQKICVLLMRILKLFPVLLLLLQHHTDPNELDLPHSICCPALHQMLFFRPPSFFIFFFTLCWQHRRAFWLCCSRPISPPVFPFINRGAGRVKEGPSRSAVYCVRLISNRSGSPSGGV